MSEPFGVIIGEPEQADRREPVTKPNANPVSGTEGGNVGVKSETPEPSGFASYDPETIAVTATPIGNGPRKRGRPPGSGKRAVTDTGSPAQKKTASAINLESILANVHCALAGLTGIQELATERGDEDLRAVADAMKELTDLYPVQLNVKAVAWVNLFTAMGGFYGTRYTAYKLRANSERKEKLKVMPAAAPAGPSKQAPAGKPNGKPNGAAAPHGLVIPDGTSPRDLWPAGAEDFPENG